MSARPRDGEMGTFPIFPRSGQKGTCLNDYIGFVAQIWIRRVPFC